jgi:hypothetical protein
MANKRFMKHIVFLSVVCLLILKASTVQAQDYKMGLGIRISSNDAIVNHSVSLKYFFREKTALEALVSFGNPPAVGLLVEQHVPFHNNTFKWFYGGGGYVAFKGTYVGLQGVLGLDYKVASLPLNFSIDWKPELNLAKEFTFEPAALGFSARFTLQ